MKISSLPEDINVKKREASQNTNLDMREFLGIDKALWTIQGEMVSITSKLMEIEECIKRLKKKKNLMMIHLILKAKDSYIET